MEYTISATNARIHFGEIMRRAQKGPVIVERSGKPEVVVISKSEYDQLTLAAPKQDWQEQLDELHKKIRIELAGRTLPAPEDIIREGRENRDKELLNNLS